MTKPSAKKRQSDSLRNIVLLSLTGLLGCRLLFAPRTEALPPAVSGERFEFTSNAGRLSYYVTGTGRPLLLIHSINAAASAYEVRPIYEHYKHTRRVYAIDLPGFGFSERSPRDYTPRLYTDAILAMLDTIQREHGPEPVDVLALSLSSEFLARAASERPELFRTLALISPTGFNGTAPRLGPPGSTLGSPLVRDLFSFPLWRRPFFELLNTRASARFFLEKTFGSKQIDEGLAEYDYQTAHQPGAEYAPFAFVSGLLFSADINRIYDALTQPILMIHGNRGDFVDFRNKGRVENLPNWTVVEYSTGALPHFENLNVFVEQYDAFLQESHATK
jgi:pimeloyl-ACP methyl ester carboxylesterase